MIKTYDYSYEIKEVNDTSMVIEYTCDGCDTLQIGARLPYGDESIDAIVEMYSPVSIWAEEDAVYAPVNVGVTGSKSASITPIGTKPEDGMSDSEVLAYRKEAKIRQLADARYFQEENGSVVVDSNSISTDRATQGKLASLVVLAMGGKVVNINWKGADGEFFTMTNELLDSVVVAVNDYVQGLFDWEKSLTDQINAATTIAELDSITF